MKKKQIKYAMVVAALASATLFSSCKKDEVKTLPPIGGFNGADEVAAANLVAHWPFEGNGNEKKSNSAPVSPVNASYTTGAKGQALSLAAGYLAYNEIAALNNMSSFTISAWVNVKNTKGTPNEAATMFFTMTRPGDWIGNINLMAETGRFGPGVDTLVAKGLFASKRADGSANTHDNINDVGAGGDRAFKTAGKWTHIVLTYDGVTFFKIYGNSKDIGSYDKREDMGKPSGPLSFFTPTKPVIGAFSTNLPGGTPEVWQKPMTGLIDELRVYNKALTAGEIGSLYQLELAGR